jgi:hypothetical protein
MRNQILKHFSFLFALILISCGGGGGDDTGGGGGGGPVDPPPTPPGKSTLVAPANNKTCETGTSVSDTQSTVAFSWNASASTNTYDVRITNLNTSTATNKNGVSSTSTTATLDKGVPYSWKVTSKNTSSTTTTGSDTWKFYLAGDGVVNYAPFPADLKTPASGSTVTLSDGKATFTWEGTDPDSGDTLSYTLQADKDKDAVKTDPSIVVSNLSSQTADVELEAATTYYWTLKTSDGTNASYSIVYSFKTQ